MQQNDATDTADKDSVSTPAAVPSPSPIIRSLPRLKVKPLEKSDTVDSLMRYLVTRLRRRYSDLPEMDAENIAMETIGKITRWELPIRDLSALAFTIAIRATYRYYKRERNRRGQTLWLNESVGEGTELGDIIVAATREDIDLRITLERALELMDPGEREIIALRVEGYTFDEIAKKVDLSRSAVVRRVERIQQNLSGFLAGG